MRENASYKQAVIDSLLQGVRNSWELKETLVYVIDNKLCLFEKSELFQGSLYEGEDEIIELILPSIRRLWSKVFINPPEILKNSQLELFQLSFDIDHFIDYLLDILPKVKHSLYHFEKLDRTSETLTLIVDNYAADLFEKSRESKDVLQEIRDLKIKKMIK